MKKFTQKDIVLRFLRELDKQWVPSYALIKLNTRWGFVGIQGDRRARELADEGKLERKHDKGYAWYRAVSKKMLVTRAEDGRILATEKVW